MTVATKKRTIEVFRPGTFTPMGGQPIAFSADDLKALAAAYDPQAHPTPLVVGHPKTDDPAFGWATAFRYDAEGERLLADIDEVEPQFADWVAAGRYKRISLSLFRPDAANNPRPGAWYPKHVGFLGAAAPAVPGLKPVAFAEGGGDAVFEFADASALRDVATLFRSMRDFVIEKFGLEAADKALPGWAISWIDDAADRPDPGRPLAAFAAGSPEPQPEPKKDPMTDATKKAEAEAILDERERRIAERERQHAHQENAAFAEGLVAERRLLPAMKAKVVGLLDGLTPGDKPQLEVSFAEGDDEKKVGALDLVKELLKSQPQVVSFGRHDIGGEPPAVDFAMPDGRTADPASAETHARAVAYQAQHPGTDYMTAVAAVRQR